MKIHLYQLTLVLDTPGGVSAPESRRIDSAHAPALPLARGAAGQPHIPATSLAGSLRAHAEKTTGGAAARLFGELRRETDRTVATASPVRILGTRTDLPKDADTLRRASTAIDRSRGAAAPATLRERELLPPGTTVTAWLRLDDTLGSGLLAAELEAVLPSWPVRIGGAQSTGHGQARLTRVTRRVLDLATPQGRRAWLTRGGPALFEGGQVIFPGPAHPAQPHDAPLVFGTQLSFAINDALHIGSGRRIESGHHATDRNEHLRDHLGRPLVPGTTWKGLLRSRCAFILRSLAEHAACTTLTGCGACPVCAAFGHSAVPGVSESGLRGRLVFLDSPVLRPDGTPAGTASRDHVALDRFTGGAAAGLLFTDEVVERGQVALTILDEPSDPHAGPLDPLLRDVLLLALYDLHTGALGIGGRTTRGCGTLHGTADTAAFLEREVPTARERLGQALPALSKEVTGR
ncbi:RAMP superfamily CRISPR-associated protein [Streptomyces sp. NPDC000941]